MGGWVLAAGGRVVLEVGHGMASAVAGIMRASGLVPLPGAEGSVRDDRGLERGLVLRRGTG